MVPCAHLASMVANLFVIVDVMNILQKPLDETLGVKLSGGEE